MPKVFIGVGSNLADRAGYLALAQSELFLVKGLKDLRCSPVYETEPVDAGGGKYLNAVWSFETGLSPEETLAVLRDIEKKSGRTRKIKNEPRPLDLDLLFYGDRVIREPGLIVPHPRLHERPFVLIPFCDLAPEWVHPVLKKTVKELFSSVQRIADSV